MEIYDYIGKICKNVNELEQKHYKHYTTKLLIAFRGEPQDFGKTRLIPSMFRESEYIYKENHLFDLFCDLRLINYHDKWIDKATTIQHYAALSRMLDITFDCLVALYFACISDEDKDGYVYVFGFPEYQSPHCEFIEQLYEYVLNFKNNVLFSKNFYVFSESYANERIIAQKGGFIFFPSKIFAPINSIYYKSIKINYQDKQKIIDDLDKIFKINTAILFPEKDKIASYAKQKFIEDEYKINQISITNEVNNRINQIYYELTMNTHMKKINILRHLRKYKEELTYYICNQVNLNSDEKENLLKKIDYEFTLLNGTFGGEDNG